jgi:hypothetical protein
VHPLLLYLLKSAELELLPFEAKVQPVGFTATMRLKGHFNFALYSWSSDGEFEVKRGKGTSKREFKHRQDVYFCFVFLRGKKLEYFVWIL